MADEDPTLLAQVGDVQAEPEGAKLSEDRIKRLLASASEDFRTDTNQHISRVVDDVATLDGDGSTVFLIPELPIVDVTRIETDRETFEGDALKGLWTARGTVRRRWKRWPWDGQSIRVTYTHGYDPVPADIVDVIVQRVLDRAGRRYGRTPASVTAGPFTATYASNNTSETKAGVSEDWARTVRKYWVDL